MAGSSSVPPTDTGKSIPPDPIGSVLAGRYRLESRLGAGGFGAVYRAWDMEEARGVAVKVLHEELGARKSLQRRFAREAKAMMALSHPNIVAIVDYGVANGAPFLAMELLEGHGLDVELKRLGSLSENRLRFVMKQLLAGIAYMHGEGLIHRDLKPGNVFVQRLPDGGDQIKVLDFGLAKFLDTQDQSDIVALTRTGEVFGTPAYMPPEQLAGEELDYRADVYTAAVMMFQMLVGRRPYEGAPHEVLRKVLVEAPPTVRSIRPECTAHPDVERWFKKALGKKPAERFADAPELQAALDLLPTPMLLDLQSEPATTELSASDLAMAGSAVDAGPPKEKAARAGFESADTVVQRASPAKLGDRQSTHAIQGAPEAAGLARLVGSIAGGMRRVVIVSATLISVLSVLVIGAAALLIFTAPDKETPTSMAAGNEGLPPTVPIVDSPKPGAKLLPGVAEAKPVLPASRPKIGLNPEHNSISKLESPLDASSPGSQGIEERPHKVSRVTGVVAEPSIASGPTKLATGGAQTVQSVGIEAEPAVPDQAAPVVNKVPPQPKRARARDPFRRRTANSLTRLRRRLLKGYKGTEKTINMLRRYNRGHPDDSRGHLLMATLYMNRIWHRDAVTQYGFAFARDAASRGYRPMLRDLIKLSGEGSARSEAMALVRRAYGPEARRALQRAIRNTSDKGQKRRLRRLESSLVKSHAGAKQ